MGNAYHFIVAREDAKKVFAQDADALQTMLEQWRNDSARESMRLETGDDWQAWDAAFESVSTASDENGPLKFVFLGGRPLPEQPGETVRLIRPDMVPHIAEVLKQVDRDSLATLGGDVDAKLTQLAALFAAAAEQRSAMLFYAPAAG
ncbi:MAG: YfbM family protein [bacterium]|nr:YfbM family protein [bacterium]